MSQGPAVKDIQDELLSTRKHRRKDGEVIYPLDYTSDMADLDNWDSMFMVSFCHRLTLHEFETPPALVLDLGCGGGYWAIEAAKKWKNSTIVGFDIKDMQPRLHQMDGYKDISRRVKWVHGNFLEVLPFPPDHFDFVRMVSIGLGVPEDEWQYVLEEVARVMKPGAVVELIEDDLLFPCGHPPSPQPPPTSSSSSGTSSTASFENWNLNTDEPVIFPVKKMLGLKIPHDSSVTVSSTAASSMTISPTSPLNRSSTLNHYPSSIHSDEDYPTDLKDHTKLQKAWKAMLTRRFLATQLVAVLPFYLSNAFKHLHVMPPLHIYMAHNSGAKDNLYTIEEDTESLNKYPQEDNEATFIDALSQLNIPIEWLTQTVAADDASVKSIDSSVLAASLSHPMHLAKVVRTITGCKEAIWVEYEALYGGDPSIPNVTRTARPNEAQSRASKPSSREAFDVAWGNWENDMADRINMRALLKTESMWDEPVGSPPEWRVWRDTLDAKGVPVLRPAPSGPHELCRTLRGFFGRKPS